MPKELRCVKCPALTLLCNRLCGHRTKKFGDPVLEQSCYLASIKRVCVWTSEACKYKKRNIRSDGGHDDFLLNWNIRCTKHAADLAL